jgi:hypothetical protein
MTSITDRLDQLLELTVEGEISSAEVASELHGLLGTLNDEVFHNKIRNAIQWSNIHSVSAQSERYGTPEQLRGWLLQDLKSAADRAGLLSSERALRRHHAPEIYHHPNLTPE